MKKNEIEKPCIVHLDEVNSTNAYIQSLPKEEALPNGSLVWADFQTAGRGQIGNVWESAAGENLTFSMIFYPSFLKANNQFLISQIVALSVKQALDSYTDDISIKWPNDIYWKDKKICGMLIENDLAGQYIYSSIIGIGININQEKFCGGAPNPVSLSQIVGKKVDVEEVLRRFLEPIYGNYLKLMNEETDEIRCQYLDSLYRKEGFFLYKDAEGDFMAEFAGIEPTGHLLLRDKNGRMRRYEFKEVKFRLYVVSCG